MSNLDDKIARVEGVEGVSETASTSGVERAIEPTSRVAPSKEHFDALMGLDQQRAQVGAKPEPIEQTSLMDQIRDLNHKVDVVSRATPREVVAQAQAVIKQIEDVKTQLAASPNMEIKGSVQALLKNKLSHIDESLKVALNRSGMEYTPQDVNPKSNLLGPIDNFIGLLTHGQYQLQSLATNVEMMHQNKVDISPASMLAIQIKVGYIQQEMELFTNMLNKSLESIKTIMNVQI